MTDTPSSANKTHRMAIRRPVTMAMLFLTLVVFGWKSYQELPINLMPDITYPTLTVRTEFEGAAPEDVEKLLTRPLEETLSIVSGLVEVSSMSSPGLSEIVMEFTWGTDMSLAQQDVRDRLDLFDPPTEVTEKPVILRYDPTLDPVLRLAIRGRDLSNIADAEKRRQQERQELLEIRDAAELHIKSDLEGEPGIAQVLIKGGREEEIQVLVDSEFLKNLGLTLEHVTSALTQQNVNYSGGRLIEGKTEYLVRTVNLFQSVAEIGQTIIGTVGSRQIRLTDVAAVIEGEKEQETVVRINGQEAVELEIYKWGDANTVQVCNKLKDLFGFYRQPTALESLRKRLAALWPEELPDNAPAEMQYYQMAKEMAQAQGLKDRLPEYVQLNLVSDQSRFIIEAIKEVKNSAVIGGLLALAILYLFLRELKSTLVIGVSIPISVVATFIPMFMQDVTMNIMSLGGLALGVGMLVDNSIVVLESVFRCKEEGDDPVEAADRGTGEVASAVTASTLTTIAVFLPLAFVEGVAGQLFRDQALTVTFSLIASLLVALYLIPMIVSRQRMAALEHRREVIWILRAYREARSAGHDWPFSLVCIPLFGIRYAWEWLCGVAEETFNPTIRGIARVAAAARQGIWLKRVLLGLLAAMGLGVLSAGAAYGITAWFRGPVFALPVAGGVLAVAVSLPFAVLVTAALLPVILVVFVFCTHVLLKTFALILVTVFFFVSMSFMAVFGAAGAILQIVLWIPLTLFDLSFTAFRDGYLVLLRKTLPISPVILLVVAGLAVHSGFLALELGRELIPPLKQGQFGIRMEAKAGTRLEDTEERARVIENILLNTPEIETVTVEVGQEKKKAEGNRGENVATFTVLLRDPQTNVERQDEIIERLRQTVHAATHEQVAFTLPSLFSFNTAVELQIRGDDLKLLEQVGKLAVLAITEVPGLEDIELSMKEGYPEIIIELDRDLCAANSLDPDTVARRLRSELHGDQPTKFDRAGSKVDIRVRTDQQRLSSLDDLRRLSIREGDPPLPLSAVAKIAVLPGPSEVRRVDQRRVAMVAANVSGRDLGSVSRDIYERLSAVDKPADYEFRLGGQNRELQTSLSSLQFALMLAIFLVYVVMACQFESIWQPGVVMGAVPLAFIGVIYVLYVLQIDVSIVVYIGGIILAGIVVNDAIVLVDCINQLRAKGMPKTEAVIQAGSIRLRPIMMTTLTTVLGLVPMATWSGEGGEMRQPMAITVMAGLTSATFLTLLIIPMLYDLISGRDKA